MFKEKKA